MHIFITGVAGFLGSNLADYYLKKGFKVSGNDNLVGGEIQNVDPKVKFYQYDTENLELNTKYFKDVDAAILSAAVADYRPKFPAVSKLKKKSSSLVLELEKTEDVLASLGEIKEKQLLIGFALETENEVANAIKKLKAKNLDLIILNSLNDDGAGFGGSTNKISIIDKDLNQTNYPLKSKSEVADDIINELIKRVHA